MAELYEHGQAVNAAVAPKIDAVIALADSRARILSEPADREADGTAPPGGHRPSVGTR
ncbi:hypothetical protein GCM10015535_33910 [Streptomyces gelaticus]|uniref:Uncharacterized protein n=1 Tax=Streptomyces gelaticus TaxID=285446 RepID=A0ABQ2VZ93_9ACTN|nr:hypothetical protein [Streptomyces gelaticus]GGV86197.1 hypothetical protein GCM10015535_33910 [Streptomyces gelaticus]